MEKPVMGTARRRALGGWLSALGGGRPAPGAAPRKLGGGLLAVAVLLGATGCEVAWGGSEVALEDPAPAADTARARQAERAERLPDLPEGPFLYLARLSSDGSAHVVPAARLTREGLADPGLPERVSARYRGRFDSTFLAPGTELHLHAGGRRIGTLVLRRGRATPSDRCPSVAAATTLLVPGQTVPAHAVALPPEASGGLPQRTPFPDPVRAMEVAGPVLAERLIADERAYLARRVSLEPLRSPGDSLPAMAATYLVNDSLAPGPPPGAAISLFFLARYDPAIGYVPEWTEVRRYEGAEGKEAFTHLTWFQAPAGRVDLLRRLSADGVRLAAGLRPEGRGRERAVTWTEGPRCSALELLERTGPAGSEGDGTGTG